MVACNSIEVSAIGDIAAAAEIPVVGVIGPGVRAALRATRNGVIGVIGTEATIRTGGYQRAVGSAAALHAAACPVFVEHVERGDTTSPELRKAAAGYLAPLKREGVDTVIMGCTHYPLLSGLLQLELGPDVVLVSSAEETAKDVYAELLRGDALRTGAEPPAPRVPRRPATPAAFRDLAELVPGSRDRARRSPSRSRREAHVRLTVLGSQGTWPGASRECCGYLVSAHGFNLWLDAGTGTFARLQEHLPGRRPGRRC